MFAMDFGKPLVRILLVNIAAYTALVNIWPGTFAPAVASLDNWLAAWTRLPAADFSKGFFNMDGDPFWINGPMHGLYGSEAYLACRTRGHSPLIAFLFAVAAATSWEYLIESWFQQPSLLDLLWTPLAGSIIGELRFRILNGTFKNIKRRFWDVVWALTIDPLGQLEHVLLSSL